MGALLFALASACAPKPSAMLPAVPASAPDFMARQHVTGRHEGRDLSFDAVVQKRGDHLLVLLLTPYGSRALAIEQTPQETRVQPFVALELPFDPRFILRDVQRVYFHGLPDPPYADGWHDARIGDEVVRERWRDGRLLQRRFRCPRCVEPSIRIEYEGGFVPGEAPGPVALVDETVGYRLHIVTTQYAAL